MLHVLCYTCNMSSLNIRGVAAGLVKRVKTLAALNGETMKEFVVRTMENAVKLWQITRADSMPAEVMERIEELSKSIKAPRLSGKRAEAELMTAGLSELLPALNGKPDHASNCRCGVCRQKGVK